MVCYIKIGQWFFFQYLESCDEIVVMKNGYISEHGTPLELKNNAGTYAELLAILQAQQEASKGRWSKFS